MWIRTLKYLAELLLLPLFLEAVAYAKQWIKDWFADRRRKRDEKIRAKENKRKADAHKNSSVDDSDDTFGNMP